MQFIKPVNDKPNQKRNILVAIVIIASLMGLISAWDWDKNTLDWRGILGNMSTELMGGVIAYFIIDQLITKNETTHTLKQRLIRGLENPEPGFVKQAVQELHDNGWLSDGSLYGWFFNARISQGSI